MGSATAAISSGYGHSKWQLYQRTFSLGSLMIPFILKFQDGSERLKCFCLTDA